MSCGGGDENVGLPTFTFPACVLQPKEIKAIMGGKVGIMFSLQFRTNEKPTSNQT